MVHHGESPHSGHYRVALSKEDESYYGDDSNEAERAKTDDLQEISEHSCVHCLCEASGEAKSVACRGRGMVMRSRFRYTQHVHGAMLEWVRGDPGQEITYIYMLCYVMLCYVMLCYVMLCYVMLCYVMLCYVMLCYVMLCYVMLCYVMLCYVMLCYVMLCYVMLCYVMLCYVMLCYVMLCYVMLCYVMI